MAHDSPSDPLDRYLDGQLDPAARRRFEQRLAEEPEVREAQAMQDRIDAALRRRHAIGDGTEAMDRLAAHLDPRGGAAHGGFRRFLTGRVNPWVAAAVLALVALPTWWWFEATRPSSPQWTYPVGVVTQPFDGPQTTLVAHYQAQVASGFEDYWPCPPRRFADTFQRRLGQAMALGPPVEGTAALGLAHAHTFSPMTLCLFGRVDGHPVIVHADRAVHDGPSLIGAAGEDGLHVHRRVADGLVLYEVSPLPTPTLVTRLVRP